MFASFYFSNNYFAARYFGEGSNEPVSSIISITYLRKHYRRRL